MAQQQALILSVNSIAARVGALEASRAIGQIDDAAKRATKGIDRLEAASQKMRKVGKAMTVGLTLPLAAVGAAVTKMAADAEEAANKFDVVMGPSAARLRQEFESLRKSIPLARYEMEALSSTTQDLLVPMGIARAQAADMSLQFLKLAGDLGSFNNVSPEEAMRAITSGLAGEAEALRRYGVDVRQARLETLAYEKGLIGLGDELDAASRGQAVMLAIMADSVDAMGDAARTADSAANQFKFLVSNAKELAVTIGQQLLPVVTPLVRGLNDKLAALGALNPETVKWGVAIGAAAALAGPAALAIGLLTKAIVLMGAKVAITSALVTGGLSVALGGLAAWWVKNKLDALDAAGAVDEFTASLSALNREQLIAQAANLELRIEKLRDMPQTGFIRDEIAALEEQGLRVAEALNALGPSIDTNLTSPIRAAADAAKDPADRMAELDRRVGFTGRSDTLGGPGLANERTRGDRMRNLRANAGGRLNLNPVSIPNRGPRQVAPGGGGGIGGMVGDFFGGLKSTVTSLVTGFGPLAAAAAVLRPVFQGLAEAVGPALSALAEPLRVVGQLLGLVITPVLELLAPPLRLLATGVSYVVEAFGWLIEALGKFVDSIVPDWISKAGKGLAEMGQAMQDGARAARENMGATDDATDAVNKFAGAVSNIPRVLNLNALRNAVTGSGGGSGGGGGAGGGTGGGGGGGGGGVTGNPRNPMNPPSGNVVVQFFGDVMDPDAVADAVGRAVSKVERRGGVWRGAVT